MRPFMKLDLNSEIIKRYMFILKGIFENLGVIDLPFNLDIAKKSLVSTMSALYATM